MYICVTDIMTATICTTCFSNM